MPLFVQKVQIVIILQDLKVNIIEQGINALNIIRDFFHILWPDFFVQVVGCTCETRYCNSDLLDFGAHLAIGMLQIADAFLEFYNWRSTFWLDESLYRIWWGASILLSLRISVGCLLVIFVFEHLKIGSLLAIKLLFNSFEALTRVSEWLIKHWILSLWHQVHLATIRSLQSLVSYEIWARTTLNRFPLDVSLGCGCIEVLVMLRWLRTHIVVDSRLKAMPCWGISSWNPVRLDKVLLEKLWPTFAKVDRLGVFLEVKLVWWRTFALSWMLILLSYYLTNSSKVAVAFWLDTVCSWISSLFLLDNHTGFLRILEDQLLFGWSWLCSSMDIHSQTSRFRSLIKLVIFRWNVFRSFFRRQSFLELRGTRLGIHIYIILNYFEKCYFHL